MRPTESGGGVDANKAGKMSMEAYNQLIDTARKQTIARQAAGLAPAPAAATPEAAPAAATPATPAAPPAPPEDKPNLRYRADPVEATLINLAKTTGKSLTDVDLINAARAVHGQPPIHATPTAAPAPAAAPLPSATPTSTPPPAPTSVTDAESLITSLKDQRKQAKENFDFEAEERLEDEIEAAKDRLRDLRTQAQQQHVSAEQQFTQEWDSSIALAHSRFPDSAKDGSALSVRAGELQQAAIATGDPVAQSAKSGLYYITQAAIELGIAPVLSKPAPTPASTPPPSSVRAPLSAMIAGGSPQSASPTNPDSRPRVTSMAEYTALTAAARGIRYGGRQSA